MPNPFTVVISQTNSKNPLKRELEEGIASNLAKTDECRVVVIHNLYDVKANGETIRTLNQIDGDFVVCAWMFERAAHWILDRNNVHGRVGEVELRPPEEADDDEIDDELVDEAEGDEKRRVIEDRPQPHRSIYCLDLRLADTPQPFVDEVHRIAALHDRSLAGGNGNGQGAPRSKNGNGDQISEWLSGKPSNEQLERFKQPTNDTALPAGSQGNGSTPALQVVEEQTSRRWYPVIDFSRCTNCMECIDFCLFGVYGVDTVDTILVEQPDNCRKGCPACSRVCPENAIIFPQHKTPTIAGAPAQDGGLKIDLSMLFGAPDAQQLAAEERDEQLVLAGRGPVGNDDELQKRQTAPAKPKDELDSLIDGLDDLDI